MGVLADSWALTYAVAARLLSLSQPQSRRQYEYQKQRRRLPTFPPSFLLSLHLSFLPRRQSRVPFRHPQHQPRRTPIPHSQHHLRRTPVPHVEFNTRWSRVPPHFNLRFSFPTPFSNGVRGGGFGSEVLYLVPFFGGGHPGGSAGLGCHFRSEAGGGGSEEVDSECFDNESRVRRTLIVVGNFGASGFFEALLGNLNLD